MAGQSIKRVGRTEAALDVSGGEFSSSHKCAVLDADAMEAGIFVCNAT